MYLNTLLVTHHEDGSTYVFYYIIQGALYDSLSDDLLAILTSLELDTTVASPQIEENILAASKLLFEDHYDSLKEFDIDDTQKLAMILTAQYLDMQNRIDINAIAALNPQINENLKLYHDEFIAQMLTTHDFELLATDSANIEEGVLTFNAAYSFLNDSSMQLGMNKSVLYNKFNYEWSELTGNWLLTGSINADTESSEKPDRLLNIYSMQDESKALFGVENLMELFNFTGKSFRDEFSELYDLY